MLPRIQVLGRVATDVSVNRNTFSVEEYFNWGRRLCYLLKRREPHNIVAEDSSSRASGYRSFWIPLYLASNSISAEDEGSTTSRNVGNHTTVLLRFQVLGRVVTEFRIIVIHLYLASNSISAEDEGYTTSRNVGNHTTVLLGIKVLGRVVTDVSENRNTFIFSVKQCFSWRWRHYDPPKRREPHT